MSVIESQAQIDNSLIMGVDALLQEGISDFVVDITNLMVFAQAVILFDKVVLPGWDQDRLATQYLPSSIIQRGVFQDELDNDYDQRFKESQELSFVLSSTESIQGQPIGSIRNITSYIDQILSIEGKTWPGIFRKHISHIRESQSELVEKEVTKILDAYSADVEYLSLPFETKIGITFLWRCLYNVNLALEKQRPYLHNIYRLPFTNAIFQNIEEQKLSLPWIKEMNEVSNISNLQPSIHRILLPSLLGRIMSRIDKKDQIIPEVYTMRESKEARAFRSHYRELQEKLGEPDASNIIEKDIKHLIDLWSGFVDPINIPVLLAHYDFLGFQGSALLQIPIPSSVVSRAKWWYSKISKRHMRFAIHLIERQQYIKQFNKMAKKVFGRGLHG